MVVVEVRSKNTEFRRQDSESRRQNSEYSRSTLIWLHGGNGDGTKGGEKF
jgi:hypothetical protein